MRKGSALKSSGLVVLFLLVGCAPVIKSRNVPFGNAVTPKAQDAPIEILDRADIKRAYKVVGLVSASTGKRTRSDQILDRLRQEARRLGGDALIDVSQGGESTTALVPTQFGLMAAVRETWSAKVIVWTDEDQP